MENENENFDKLTKLLALKKHELPPPGYFNKLPGEVVSRIRADRARQNLNAASKLEAEAPWLMKFWRTLAGKPVFAVSFGTAICALMLSAIFFSEKPPEQPGFAGTRNAVSLPVVAAAPVGAGGEESLLANTATNQNPPNLFEMISNGPTAPAGYHPQ